MNEAHNHTCFNCEKKFDFEFDYCPSCGQKNTNGKVTFSELWEEFQVAVFNIESKTWQTLITIFVPGKLTLEYFAGKHRQFVHPLRLLVVSSILIIIALSFQGVQSSTNHFYNIKDRIVKNYERQRSLRILGNIADNTNMIYPDTIAMNVTDTILAVYEDSLIALLPKYGDQYRDSINVNYYISFTDDTYENISKHDFLNMTEDELVEKYKGDKSPIDQLIFKQKIKYINDETKLASGMVGRFTWAILFMMPIVALVLYLLYFRNHFYYIENLIFTFHIHSFAFIIATLYVLGWNIFPEWVIQVCIFIVEFYLLIAMWKVYKQSFLMTILKFLLLNVFYIGLFILFVVSTFFVSFLLM